MRNLLVTKKNKAAARVVDGKLILSFPDAITPVLWQMDLDEAKASALEVQENKKDKIYTLALKTPRGEAVDIAAFDERTEAVNGLMAASHALSSAHGQIRPASASAAPGNVPSGATSGPREKGIGKWGGIALLLVFLFILINVWGSLATRTTASSKISPTTFTPSSEAGVPMSADDFLKNR
ncbi:MAG: hypothetical protein DHS20C02_12120 [Micavibrio sp.]|nr:MAG: hypothetical protein DHS20C02_12120 [Micavibrio sp.]